MKKFLFLILLSGLIAINSSAQVAYYSFSQSSGTFDTLTTGTVLGSATTGLGTYFVDAAVPAGSTTIFRGVGIPIGFTFTYNDSIFNVFGVNADGWISFGKDSVNMNSSNVASPISATSTAPIVLQNRVSAFGRALAGQTGSQLSYTTSGTAPNRVLVVEWKKFRRSATSTGDNLSFQIRLHETTNIIEFKYGTVTYTGGGGGTCQVGLRGKANTDFNNRTSTTNWAATTAGGTNASTISVSTTVFPASGLTFIWTAPSKTDAGISVINSPVNSLVNGLQNVAVTIKNFGTDSLKNASIAWSVNGVLQTPHAWTGKIAIGAINGPDTIGTYTFTTAGIYLIKAWSENPNGTTDLDHINDTTTKTVYVYGYASIPFMENFDNTWITASHEVPTIYWTNTPETGNTSWRRNDDNLITWTTNTGNGTYTPTGAGSGSNLHSARFHSAGATAGTTGLLDAHIDFTPAGSKLLKFYHINTSGTDTLKVYLSTDGGTNYNLIQYFATAATWTERTINLGSSTAANAIVRFSVKNITAGTTQTDVGLDSVRVVILPTNDAGVAVINSPSTSLVTGTTNVAVTIGNFGADTLKTASIAWSVNGVTQTPHAWAGNLGFNLTNGPDTIGTFNFTTPGLYIIKAWTVNPNGNADGNHLNDTTSKVVYVAGYATLPFNESFDQTWITATREVPSIHWVNNPPAGNNSWRRNDDNTITWTTNTGNGAYTPTGVGTGTLHSARFHSAGATASTTGNLDAYLDFTPVGTKMLKFWHINTSGTDTLKVFMSNDGGTNFNLLQKFATAATWTERTITLGTSTAANSILRFSVTNLTAGTTQTDVGVDSVQVYLKPANEMAAISWLAPTGGCGLSASDTVTIKITNVGDAAQSNIPVYYSINGGQSFVGPETIAGPVNPGDTVNYTFTQHANFSATQSYNCIAYVKLTGDLNHANDTVKTVITKLGTLSGNPFIDSLEAGNKYYTMTNGINSAVALAATVGTQSTHGFHMTGGAQGTWPASSAATTTSAQAFSYSDHVTTISTCAVDASAFTSNMYLSFDLKQTHSQTTGNKYCYFAVVANGTDTLTDMTGTKYFNPVTATADPFTKRVFNMTSYLGSALTLKFIAACKYDDVTFGSTADNVYLDNIALSVKPVVNLGPDTSYCPGSSVVLNAGASPMGYTYTYSWSTLLHPAAIATTQTYAADSTATYIANVNNGYGVTSNDTIIVGQFVSPTVSLGNDTTHCGSYTLNPGAGYSSYAWSTGATTQTLNVTTTGIYWVDVTNVHGCVARDSAHVIIIPLPTDYAGAVQSLCYLDTLNLLGSTAANYDSLLWTSSGNGHFNDSTLLHPKYIFGTTDITNTTVTLTLTAYAACDTVSSSVVITITTTPNANAGADELICSGETVQLLATGGSTYAWSPSTGLDNAGIANPLANPTSTTTYVVTVTSSCGSVTDNVTVTVDHIVAPSLGNDTTLCDYLSVLMNAGAGYDSYLWSTGATTQSITLDTTGIGAGTFTIWVRVEDGACTSSDTMKVTFTSCVGVAEFDNDPSITIYPNPTNGLTNIIVKGMNSNAELSIYTLQGQSVYHAIIENNSIIQIDLSYLPKGIYMIKTQNEKNAVISKLILQ